MTLITEETREARGAADAPGIAVGLLDLATWYATHPSAPLVTPTLNIPVPPGARGERIAALQEIADALGVDVVEQKGPNGEPDGTLVAERWFGPVRVEAHLCHPDQTVSGAKSRAAAAGILPVQAERPAA